jgi:hypothetical protein
MAKHRVNWDFKTTAKDGKGVQRLKAGDEVDLTDEQVKAIGASSAITPLSDVPKEIRKGDDEAQKREEEEAQRLIDEQRATDERNARETAARLAAAGTGEGENASDAAPTAKSQASKPETAADANKGKAAK